MFHLQKLDAARPTATTGDFDTAQPGRNMSFVVRRLTNLTDAQIVELARFLLIDCVDGGASVSFMHPLSIEKASALRHCGAGRHRSWSTCAPRCH